MTKTHRITASFLSAPQPITFSRYRILEDRYPEDILPPEYSASFYTSDLDDGHWKPLGHFPTRTQAETCVEEHKATH